jgi:hypothetical protein
MLKAANPEVTVFAEIQTQVLAKLEAVKARRTLKCRRLRRRLSLSNRTPRHPCGEPCVTHPPRPAASPTTRLAASSTPNATTTAR